MNKRFLNPLLILPLLLAVFLSRIGNEGKPKKQSPEEGRGYYRVVSIHDGDTVTLDINGREEKIRLIGMDAPELGQRPWGQRAKKHLDEFLSKDQSVTLEYDIEKRDRYGRLLAYLWTKNKTMINLRMVADGYAVLLTIPPNVRHVDEFRQAQKKAREAKLGIWAKGGLREKPADYRERQRESRQNRK